MKNITYLLILLFSLNLSAKDVFLECIGKIRSFKYEGSNIEEEGQAYDKTYQIVLQDKTVEILGKQAEYTNKTKTYFTWWYSQPKEESHKAGPQIISGELNRISGKVSIRETWVFDEKTNRYNEDRFNGVCEKTEQKF